MIVNKYNKGGGGSPFDPTQYYTKSQVDAEISGATEGLASEEYVDDAIEEALTGITLDDYWTSGETKDYVDEAISGLTDMIETKEEVIASALTELNETFDDYYTMDEVDEVIEEALSGVSFDGYWTSGETKSYVDNAASAITSQVEDVERVTATALTELHDAILEISGSTGGSSFVIPAITSQTEYDSISGDVKTGDLIQVFGVDINDDGEDEYGLFHAEVDQGSNSIIWDRRDSGDSLLWADKIYPWMVDNGVWPADFGEGVFLISSESNSEDEAYNGIGFDVDGKPVITHIIPQYDEQTGEITGVTRTDTPIGPDQAKEEVIAAALVDLNEKKVESQDVKHIVKLTQAEYDLIASPDPETLYIIINNQ